MFDRCVKIGEQEVQYNIEVDYDTSNLYIVIHDFLRPPLGLVQELTMTKNSLYTELKFITMKGHRAVSAKGMEGWG